MSLLKPIENGLSEELQIEQGEADALVEAIVGDVARAMLRLLDKPDMLPKQGQDHEIQIIQKPTEPEVMPRCDYKNRRHHVD